MVIGLSDIVASTVQSQRERTLATSTLLGPNTQAPCEDPTSWWRLLSEARVMPLSIPWRLEPCQHCGVLLLSTENPKWCCRGNQSRVPKLPPYPPSFESFRLRHSAEFTRYCRPLNNLFAFSSIGATGGFSKLPVPSNVAIHGRIYHQLRDIDYSGQHSLRWYLFDQQERARAGHGQGIPPQLTNALSSLLESVNQYLPHLRAAVSTVPPGVHVGLELEDTQAAAHGDIAAIVHITNMHSIKERSIVIHRRGDNTTQRVSSLSRHYEPLQYPLLFPASTLGWGPYIDTVPKISQIEWYRDRLLQEPRFLWFGRLANEYAVDMFSWVEEEHLGFIKRSRLQQRAD